MKLNEVVGKQIAVVIGGDMRARCIEAHELFGGKVEAGKVDILKTAYEPVFASMLESDQLLVAVASVKALGENVDGEMEADDFFDSIITIDPKFNRTYNAPILWTALQVKELKTCFEMINVTLEKMNSLRVSRPCLIKPAEELQRNTKNRAEYDAGLAELYKNIREYAKEHSVRMILPSAPEYAGEKF